MWGIISSIIITILIILYSRERSQHIRWEFEYKLLVNEKDYYKSWSEYLENRYCIKDGEDVDENQD